MHPCFGRRGALHRDRMHQTVSAYGRTVWRGNGRVHQNEDQQNKKSEVQGLSRRAGAAVWAQLRRRGHTLELVPQVVGIVLPVTSDMFDPVAIAILVRDTRCKNTLHV